MKIFPPPNTPSGEIVAKDYVVRKLAAGHNAAVLDVVGKVNQTLKDAADLPVVFGLEDLGSPRVRDEVLRRLRAAGWRVEENRERNVYEVS